MNRGHASIYKVDDILTANGWRTVRNRFDEDLHNSMTYELYITVHSAEFRIEIVVNHSTYDDNLTKYDLGIYSVRAFAAELDLDNGIDLEDAVDIIKCIRAAEDNLLLIGVPFCDGYFNRWNKRSKHYGKCNIYKRQTILNNKLREKFKIN